MYVVGSQQMSLTLEPRRRNSTSTQKNKNKKQKKETQNGRAKTKGAKRSIMLKSKADIKQDVLEGW